MSKQILRLKKVNDKIVSEPLELSKSEAEKLSAYIKIRDVYFNLHWLENQNNGVTDTSDIRAELNALYQVFYEEFGRMGKSRNRNLIINTDPYGFFICSSVEFKQGLDFIPSTVLTQNPNGVIEIFKTENVHEALSHVLGIYGEVNLNKISDICDKEIDEVLRELSELIYWEPIKSKWVTQEEWLSGNVYIKMEKTKELLNQLENEREF